MQLVLLAGELGEKYGKQHEYYNLQTPADAIKLLCINYPALKQELVQAHHNGVGYKVIQGGAAMGYDELQLPFGSKPLLVVPVISGAGGGATTQILAGAGLIAASFLLPGAGLFGTQGLITGATTGTFSGLAATSGLAGTLTTVGTSISAVGAGLVLGGTASLISPQPQLGNLGANRIRGEGTNVRGPGPDGISRGASGIQSYAFTGPANTVGTGATVPVIYGRVIAGSHLVAVNLDITDESDPLKIATQEPTPKNLKVNGEELTNKLEDCGGLDSRRNPEAIKSTDSARRKRVRINHTFTAPLEEGAEYDTNKTSVNALQYKNDDRRKKLDVILEVKNGLYDFAGKRGTTKIDGYIRYKITAEITTGMPDTAVAVAEVSLQGLTNETQPFRVGHRLEMPKVEGKSGEDLDLKVELIDVAVHDQATFTINGYGYNLL
jgi:predicted phage tail protein|tara:strand:- start:2177 stop:3487 length:1311 start_codon:yes stop_codon:yes gene_type:complete